MSASPTLIEPESKTLVNSPLASGETVSVILPCLNEAESVGLCVRAARAALEASGLSGEVVVVDNGSTDRSPQVAREAGARVVVEGSRGYGRALKTGIESASGSIIVMSDADWSYDFQKIPDLVAPIVDRRADLVIGSRYQNGAKRHMPLLHRYVGTPALTSLIRWATSNPHLTDSQSGYRSFRKEIATGLGLQSNGMEFASEMLIKAASQGLRVVDIPAGYRERIGKSKLNSFKDGWRHLKLIFLLAPQLLLLTPGIALLALGLILTLVGFTSPSGLRVGSVRWQPVFFSTIATVLGLQSMMMGTVLTHRSPLIPERARRRFAFVRKTRFVAWCLTTGAICLLLGLGLDLLLFARWFSGGATVGDVTPELASTAQTLIIGGGSLLTFGIVIWSLNGLGRPISDRA